MSSSPYQQKRILSDLNKLKSIEQGYIKINAFYDNNIVDVVLGCYKHSQKIYNFKMCLRNDYPFTSPVIKFTNKIYHPNISPEGVYTIKEWNPIFGLVGIVLDIIIMLDGHVEKNCIGNLNAICDYNINPFLFKRQLCMFNLW